MLADDLLAEIDSLLSKDGQTKTTARFIELIAELEQGAEEGKIAFLRWVHSEQQPLTWGGSCTQASTAAPSPH